MNITINDFDNIMKLVINRQIELGTKLNVYELVNEVLNNVNNNNYRGITSKCLPFFQSINIRSTMENLMGCNFENAVYLYSKRMEAIYNKKSNDFQIIDSEVITHYKQNVNKNVNSMEEAKNLVDLLFETMSYNEVKEFLKNSYNSNSSLKYFIDQGDKIVYERGGVFLNTNFDTKIENFINYVRNLYELDKTNEHKTIIKNNMKEIDNLIGMYPDYNQKTNILKDLYYGNDSSTYLPSSINKEYVQIALVRNVIQTSLVSTNVKGLSREEEMLYYGLENKQDIMIFVRLIVDKLLNQDSKIGYKDISVDELYSNLSSNLTEIDVNNLAILYTMMRRNEETINILENANIKEYKLEDANTIQFSNTSSLLKCIESKDFFEKLNVSYHM